MTTTPHAKFDITVDSYIVETTDTHGKPSFFRVHRATAYCPELPERLYAECFSEYYADKELVPPQDDILLARMVRAIRAAVATYEQMELPL